MVKRYLNYSLPIELSERVKKLIEEHRDLGYTSVSEFAKDAIRRLLIEYETKK
jgi:Arc/MetJ-type ribon-helix-helix transcriptional regulator